MFNTNKSYARIIEVFDKLKTNLKISFSHIQNFCYIEGLV